jgi:hypothetical protein
MEQADIWMVSNLMESISNGVPWELDKALREKILSEIKWELFSTSPYGHLYYSQVFVSRVRDLEDAQDWKHRQLNLTYRVSGIEKFQCATIQKALRVQALSLPDKLIVIVGAILILKDKTKLYQPLRYLGDENGRLGYGEVGLSDTVDFSDLPAETKSILHSYKVIEKDATIKDKQK